MSLVSGVKLLRSVDQRKDQTFFLAQVNQEALRRTVFPVGDFRKDVVKKIAEVAGMERIAQKKEVSSDTQFATRQSLYQTCDLKLFALFRLIFAGHCDSTMIWNAN